MASAISADTEPRRLALLIATCENPVPSPSLASEPAILIACSRGESITRGITSVMDMQEQLLWRQDYNQSSKFAVMELSAESPAELIKQEREKRGWSQETL